MMNTVLKALGALVGVGALFATLLLTRGPSGPPLISGIVEADAVRVGSRVGGRVQAVHVGEGDAVRAGQELLSLEPFDLDERLSGARAELEAARARQQRLEAGSRPEEIAQAEALRAEAAARLAELRQGPRSQEIAAAAQALALAQAELELSEQERQRAVGLHAGGTSSREVLDVATARHKAAAARVAARQAELELLQEGTRAETVAQAQARLHHAEAALALVRAGAREEDRAAARWQVQAAEAAVAALEAAGAELAVRAPWDGLVEALELQPGDLVAPNAPLLSLRSPGRHWVRAYLPAPYLAQVREGTTLPVRVDGLGPDPLQGRVRFVARVAEFTPSNVQTPDERQRQVFRIEVELDDPAGLLRPGMNADLLLPPESP